MINQKTNSSHKFDPRDYLEEFKRDMMQASSPEEVLLAYTHHKEIKNGIAEYVSRFSYDVPKELEEYLKNNPSGNSYFTSGREVQLYSYRTIYSGIIAGILDNSWNFPQYISSVRNAISFIDNTAENDEKLLKIFDFLIDSLKCLHKSQKNCAEIAINSMCYSMEILICALIEKLLRIVFVTLSKNNGSDISRANTKSLGQLFELTQKDLLGEIHTHNLQRFLHKFNGVGYNLRNDLAHCNDVNKERLTPEFVYFLLWLFTDVLNTVLLYFLDKRKS